MPYGLGANLLENSFAEKDLGVWVEQWIQASNMPWSQRQPAAPRVGGPFPWLSTRGALLQGWGTAGLPSAERHIGTSPAS